MQTAQFWIEKLDLQKHPEGGWFKEVYRSEELAKKSALPETYSGDRNFSEISGSAGERMVAALF